MQYQIFHLNIIHVVFSLQIHLRNIQQTLSTKTVEILSSFFLCNVYVYADPHSIDL